jgi:alkane 1-monooxygenase
MPILAKTHRQGIARAIQQPPSRWWLGFSLCLFLPGCTLAFLATGPHSAAAAGLWTLPVWLLIAADRWGPAERRQVPFAAPTWFFDGLLYALVGLQALNLPAMGWMVSRLEWSAAPDWAAGLVNLLAVRILMGSNSCCAAIAPAHELIHRRNRWQRWLGRMLLITVGYDHFYLAHRCGHHAQLGHREDPSTAREDESYEAFFRRSLAAQWRIAWRAGRRSLAAGLAAEAALWAGFAWAFGPLAAFMLGYQAVVAVRLLEAVNYFQHFGLTRDSSRAGATAWACDSAVSLFLFLGLTRHADHHRRPGVPYPWLRSLSGELAMPCGYLWMAIWVKNRSAGYRRWAAGRWG